MFCRCTHTHECWLIYSHNFFPLKWPLLSLSATFFSSLSKCITIGLTNSWHPINHRWAKGEQDSWVHSVRLAVRFHNPQPFLRRQYTVNLQLIQSTNERIYCLLLRRWKGSIVTAVVNNAGDFYFSGSSVDNSSFSYNGHVYVFFSDFIRTERKHCLRERRLLCLHFGISNMVLLSRNPS